MVFLSHSSVDRPFVEKEIIPLLERHGIAVWYSRTDIQTAQQWERSIRRGLESSEWFVIVLSRNSATSEWVRHELNWAVEHRWDPARIIPISIDDSEPDAFHISLPRLQRVDFFGDPEATVKLVQPFLSELRDMADDSETQTARVKRRVSELATVTVPIPSHLPINVVDSLKA